MSAVHSAADVAARSIGVRIWPVSDGRIPAVSCGAEPSRVWWVFWNAEPAVETLRRDRVQLAPVSPSQEHLSGLPEELPPREAAWKAVQIAKAVSLPERSNHFFSTVRRKRSPSEKNR